jgi:membrane-associated phospholipid phosphatase
MHQNSQIKPYPLEILISIYLIFTGILIIFFHSQLTNINTHLSVRVSVLLLLLLLSHQKIEKWSFIEHLRVFLPFFLLAYLYGETDYMNNLFFSHNLDPYVSNFEFFLFSSKPSISFASKFPSNFFAELMYFGYFSYYLLVIGIPIYIYFFKDETLGLRVIFILMCSFLIYYTIFIFFPVSGPQFYYSNNIQSLPQGFLFGKTIRLIQYYGEAPTAAFPSSHVSICMMLLWICFKHVKKLLWVIIPVSLLLFFSTVYIRAHYLVDVMAGLLFTPIVYSLSVYIYKIMNKNILVQISLGEEYEYSN